MEINETEAFHCFCGATGIPIELAVALQRCQQMALILCTSEKNTKPSYQCFAAHSPFWGIRQVLTLSHVSISSVFVLPLFCVLCGIHIRFGS